LSIRVYGTPFVLLTETAKPSGDEIPTGVRRFSDIAVSRRMTGDPEESIGGQTPAPVQRNSVTDRRSRGYPRRAAVIRTVSKVMTNEPP
jgi:hypothetical protein